MLILVRLEELHGRFFQFNIATHQKLTFRLAPHAVKTIWACRARADFKIYTGDCQDQLSIKRYSQNKVKFFMCATFKKKVENRVI